MAVLFSDEFTGPAGQTLGTRSGWTFVGGSGGAVEVNGANQLRNTNTLAAGIAYTTPDLGTPDHWVKWRFLTDNCLPFVCIRLLNNQTWGAGARMDAGSLVVWQRNAGTYTLLGNLGPVPGFNTADEWELRPSGNSGQIFRNGVAFGTPFAINIQPTRTFAGLFGRTASVDPWIDDVSAGDLSGGSPGDWPFLAALAGAPGAVALAAEHTRPGWPLTATLAGGPAQMSLAGTHAPPGASLTAALVGAPGQIALAGAHARPAWSLAAPLVGAPGQVALAGSHTGPAWPLAAALLGAPGQVALAAAHGAPGASLAAAVVGAPGQLALAGAHTRPGWPFSAALHGAPAQVAAAGGHSAPGPVLSLAMVGSAGQIALVGQHGAPPPVQPGSGAPVVATLSLERLLQPEFRLLPLLTLTMEMDGKPMTTTLRPIAGEEMELRLRVRTPAGALVAAGGIVITAKPPGGAPVRTYAAVAAGLGDWTATVLFDAPGRWWVSGACQTPSRAIAEFPVEVQPRAVS